MYSNNSFSASEQAFTNLNINVLTLFPSTNIKTRNAQLRYTHIVYCTLWNEFNPSAPISVKGKGLNSQGLNSSSQGLHPCSQKLHPSS